MRWKIILVFFAISVSCFSQDPYLFIGTYTSGQSKGIYVFRFNTTTGTGMEVSTMKAANPSYLSISPDGKHVYAASEGEKEGAVITNFQTELATLELYKKHKKTVFFICQDNAYIYLSTMYQHIIDVIITHNIAVYEEICRLLPNQALHWCCQWFRCPGTVIESIQF